jgi:hypothetical protein
VLEHEIRRVLPWIGAIIEKIVEIRFPGALDVRHGETFERKVVTDSQAPSPALGLHAEAEKLQREVTIS